MVEKLHIIRHFHISHNAPYLSFLLGITALPREIEKNAYAKLCHC